MLLAVISDTHGQTETTAMAVHVMKEEGVELVIHCGDVGGAAIVGVFETLPVHFVAGNCDSSVTLQMAAESAGQTFHGRVGELFLQNRKIAFLHGDSNLAVQRLLEEGESDLIAFGHTHVAQCQWYGKTLLLNPGAMTRCEQPSIALVRLPELEVTPIALDWV